jgi:hypothetical protein
MIVVCVCEAAKLTFRFAPNVQPARVADTE